MTTPQRVQRHRKSESDLRKVRTTGVNRLGTRTVVRPPKQPAPKAQRPQYRETATMTGLSGVFSALAFMTGSIFWAVGAVTTAAGTAAVARIEYRRELAQVKAAGKPIGAKDPAPAAQRTDDLEDRPEPKPVDLDAPRTTQQRAAQKPPPQRRQAGPKKPAGDHADRCKAKPPGGPTCRCPDGPNRKGGSKKTTTKRATGARKKAT